MSSNPVFLALELTILCNQLPKEKRIISVAKKKRKVKILFLPLVLFFGFGGLDTEIDLCVKENFLAY